MVFARERNCIAWISLALICLGFGVLFQAESAFGQNRRNPPLADEPLPQFARFRIGSQRFIHPSTAASVALSQDEKSLFSWGDGQLVCWDTTTGARNWLEDFTAEVDSIYGARPLAVSRDGHSIFSVNGLNGLLRFSRGDGFEEAIEVKHTLPLTAENRPASALPGSFRSIDLHPSGTRIAAAGAHGVVICDARGTSLFEIPNSPTRAITPTDWYEDPGLFGGHYSSAIFSGDGQYLAVLLSQSPQSLLVFDATTGKEIKRMECASRVVQFAFSPDGQMLATFERNRALKQFSVESGQVQWQLQVGAAAEATQRSFATLQYTSDGKRIVIASSQVEVVNAVTGKLLSRSQPLRGRARSMAIAAKSGLIYLILDFGKIVRVSLESNEILSEEQTLRAPHLLAAGNETTSYAFVDMAGEIRIGDTAVTPDPTKASQPQTLSSNSPHLLAMSRDGLRLAAAKFDDQLTVDLWNVANGSLKNKSHTLLIPQIPPTSGAAATDQIKILEFSSDGSMLAAVVAGREQAFLWNVTSGKLIATVEHPLLNCLTFDRTSSQLLTGGGDDCLRFWECATGKLSSTKEIQGGELQNVRCSPKSDLLVTAHFPNVLRYWKASDMTLKKRTPLSGETNFEVLRFSANGNWLLTTSSGYLLLVDTISGNVVWKNGFHPSRWVSQAAFSSDDKRLLSAGRDGVGYCWDLFPVDAEDTSGFARVWSSLRDEATEDINESLWQLVQMSDAAVELIDQELEPVTRVVSINAITRGLSRSIAEHRAQLANQLSEKDSTVEIESRVKFAMSFLVLHRSPRAIALLERLAASHACDAVRKVAATALDSLQ